MEELKSKNIHATHCLVLLIQAAFLGFNPLQMILKQVSILRSGGKNVY